MTFVCIAPRITLQSQLDPPPSPQFSYLLAHIEGERERESYPVITVFLCHGVPSRVSPPPQKGAPQPLSRKTRGEKERERIPEADLTRMTIDSLQPTSLVIFLFLEHDWTPFASNVQFVSHTRIRAKRLVRVEKGRTVGWRWSVGNESTGMDIFGSVSILYDNSKSTTIRNNKKSKDSKNIFLNCIFAPCINFRNEYFEKIVIFFARFITAFYQTLNVNRGIAHER